jgi:hypothetical protein
MHLKIISKINSDWSRVICQESLDLLHKSKIRTPPRQSYALSPLPLPRGGVGGGVLGTFARGLFVIGHWCKTLRLKTEDEEQMTKNKGQLTR